MAALLIPTFPNKNVNVQSYPMATDEAVVEGSAVYLDASGLVTVCGADPTTILGFAQHGAGTGASAVLEIDIYSGDILVALAYPGATFWMGASAQLDQADEGVQYGLAMDATTKIWYVDLTETTTVSVVVEKIDLTRYSQGLAEVSLLPAVRQIG